MEIGRPIQPRRFYFNGRKLRAARRVKGWSCELLGEAIGCSGQTVSNYERGASKPKLAALEALERLLGLKPGDLRQ